MKHRVCSQCGSGKYYCKGLCKSCYTKQLVPAKWSRNFDSCVRCNSSEFPHVANGLCRRCYATQITPNLCACGCGNPVTRVGNKIRKYAKGHWMKNNPEFMKAHIEAFSGENNPWYGKFGKNHPAFRHEYSPEQKEQRRQNQLKSMKKRSKQTKIEKILSDLLDSMSIKHVSQETLHKKFAVDEFLPKYNLVIEAQGRFWHGDPRHFPNPSKLQIKSRLRDSSKSKYLVACGHRVVFLWEDELTNNIEWCRSDILYAIENFRIPLVQDSIQREAFHGNTS